MSKAQTHDPVREAFGDTALVKLSSRQIRIGLDKLRAMAGENIEEIKAIRSRTVDGIMDGTSNAIDAVLKPDGEMEAAQRWKLAIATAIEAAERAHELVEQREKSSLANERREKLIEALRIRQRAAERLQAAVIQVAEAMGDVDRAGMEAVKASGIRISGSSGSVFRREHIQHLISLALHRETGGFWVYDRVPPMGALRAFTDEIENLGLSLINEYQEKMEASLSCVIDWAPVSQPEPVGAE